MLNFPPQLALYGKQRPEHEWFTVFCDIASMSASKWYVAPFNVSAVVLTQP